MLVFIDDSGDPGFKFDRGSTRYFVVLLLIFENELAAEEAITIIKNLRNSLNFRDNTEFKFQKSSREIRMEFLEAVNQCNFEVSALIIDKTEVDPGAVPPETSFYQYALEKALKHPQSSVSNAKIWIDGSGNHAFKKNFIAQLRRRVNTGSRKIIKRCALADSKSNVLIQMADMLAGAIRRSLDATKNDSRLYKSKFKKHINGEWRL